MLNIAPSYNEWTLMIAFLQTAHFDWLMPPKNTDELIKACMKPAVYKQFESIQKQIY